MEEAKAENRGGARAGAGRKKGGTNAGEHKSGRLVISCLKSEEAAVRALAEKSGKTISRFLIDLALNAE